MSRATRAKTPRKQEESHVESDSCSPPSPSSASASVSSAVLIAVDKVQFPGVRKCSRSERLQLAALLFSNSTNKHVKHIFAVSVQALGRHGSPAVKEKAKKTKKTKKTANCSTPIVQPLPTPAAGRDNVSMSPENAGPGKRSGAVESSPSSSSSSLAVGSISTPKRSSVAHTAAQRIASWSPSSFRESTTSTTTTTTEREALECKG
ncbi:hypothetical protein FQN49_008832, partial [Arthroderma sp. PD_2]